MEKPTRARARVHVPTKKAVIVIMTALATDTIQGHDRPGGGTGATTPVAAREVVVTGLDVDTRDRDRGLRNACVRTVRALVVRLGVGRRARANTPVILGLILTRRSSLGPLR